MVLPNGQSWRPSILNWIEHTRSSETTNTEVNSVSYFSGNRCPHRWKFWLKKSPRWYLHGNIVPNAFGNQLHSKTLKIFQWQLIFFHSHLDHCRSPCSLQIKVSSLHAFSSTPFHSPLDMYVRMQRARNHSPPWILLRWSDFTVKCAHIYQSS